MDAQTQIHWVWELGAPTRAGTYRFGGGAVEITQADIDRARAELAKVSEVIFNATLTKVSFRQVRSHPNSGTRPDMDEGQSDQPFGRSQRRARSGFCPI
jgi:hypothetical protein